MMEGDNFLHSSFERIKNDLRTFINLSLHEDENSWSNWITSVGRRIDTRCWERKSCTDVDCPAYRNTCGRCWIISGTLCGDNHQTKFANKYQSCKECDIYNESIYQNPIVEIEEHLIILVHSLRVKQQELHQVATIDFLTQLHNRRYLDSYLRHEQEKLKRRSSGLMIMMIDINNFKQINDTFGHAAGDRVLEECAKILVHCTRKSDVVARYGGDEFIIALHEDNDGENHVQALITRIEWQIACWNALEENAETLISLSYGYAPLRKDDDVDQVIALADQAMYADKKRRKAEGY